MVRTSKKHERKKITLRLLNLFARSVQLVPGNKSFAIYLYLRQGGYVYLAFVCLFDVMLATSLNKKLIRR